MLIETRECQHFEARGHITIYKPYGCVPLILKGKGFSVPVAHPHPAAHRVPPVHLFLEPGLDLGTYFSCSAYNRINTELTPSRWLEVKMFSYES